MKQSPNPSLIIAGARFALGLGASPAVYQNVSSQRQLVVISGGTVSLIEFSRDGATFDVTGLIAGTIELNPLDRVRVTYAVIPTVAVGYPL